MLCGCGVSSDPELTSEISDIIAESDVELETDVYYRLHELTTEYPNGDISNIKYPFSTDSRDFMKESISCVYYENGR